PLGGCEPTGWEGVIAIKLYGVLHSSKAVLPVMAEQGSGVVVNLGLAVGRVGSSGEVVCSAAKGGIIAFTKSLAKEMARHQVRVNCVCAQMRRICTTVGLPEHDCKPTRTAAMRALTNSWADHIP